MKSLLDKSVHKYAGFVAFIFSMLIILLLLSIYTSAYAEKSLGIGIQQSVDGELSIGITGEYETEKVDIEYEYQGLEYHDAKIDVSFRQSLTSWLDVTVFQENDWEGYSLTEITRKNDLGISGIIPIRDVDIEFAVFGRNGKNPVAPTKVPGDYNADTDTFSAVSDSPGLTAVSGPHISLATAFDVKEIEIEVKGLTNIDKNPTLQWLVDGRTTHKIGPFDWTLSAQYEGQRHEDQRHEDIIEDSISGLLTFGITW